MLNDNWGSLLAPRSQEEFRAPPGAPLWGWMVDQIKRATPTLHELEPLPLRVPRTTAGEWVVMTLMLAFPDPLSVRDMIELVEEEFEREAPNSHAIYTAIGELRRHGIVWRRNRSRCEPLFGLEP